MQLTYDLIRYGINCLDIEFNNYKEQLIKIKNELLRKNNWEAIIPLNLVPNKEKFIIHYKNLQQGIRNGLVVTKKDGILTFKQSPWLENILI